MACPHFPRKKSKIDALINNMNFQNIDLLPLYCESQESDDQIFAFAVIPHIYTFHSCIVHISTSADGHIHDMEMHKLILLISKLQKFNFSITFICSDGETGLTKILYTVINKILGLYSDCLIMLMGLFWDKK